MSHVQMSSLAACTIVAHNYLPLARIVAKSFLKFHPEAMFYIVIVDHPLETKMLPNEDYRIISIVDMDFGDEGFEYMATIYDVTEFATSVKPFVLRHLVQFHECVLYLDPDIEVFASLQPLIEKTNQAGWSLTPHCLEPIIRNGAGPTEKEIMAAGVYNLGYVGVTPRAADFLDWWGERLRRDAIIDVENQLFTDQRWIDLAVGIFAPYIERSTSYNVAYWNLDQRRVWRDGNTWMVDDDVLRFFHFSGYDPQEPYWLSKYQPGVARVLMSEHPELADLFLSYREKLLNLRPIGEKIPKYGWGEAFPGYALGRGIRRRFRQELLLAEKNGTPWPPSPFVPGQLKSFVKWIQEIPTQMGQIYPRFAAAIVENRKDLNSIFSLEHAGTFDAFREWVRRSGRIEYPDFDLFGAGVFDSSKPQSFDKLRDIGRNSGGVDVIGYFNAELGVGEAGRLLVQALKEADVQVRTGVCTPKLSRNYHEFPIDGFVENHVAVLAVNADQVRPVLTELGPEFFQGRRIIGQWFWELSQPPREYEDALGLVHEVWAPTTFIQKSIQSLNSQRVEVIHMPLPFVRPEIDATKNKSDFSLPDSYMFLFTFDFLSVMKRKNPLGVIESFKKAFQPNEGPILVLKTINGMQRLKDLEAVRWACRERSDIIIIDEYFTKYETSTLMSLADCYVSLHRSEGLGLTLAESMLLGKPVIATAYSGNMDFMNSDNSFLVDWMEVSVGKGAEGYPASAMWAEPDIDHASQLMKYVYHHQDEAAEVGKIARNYLEREFSLKACGERMKNRVKKFWV